MTTPVLTEQDGPLRRLRLNRPKSRNAIDPGLIKALDDALTEAMGDPATEAVVISGNGPSFCAGADLRHLLELARNGEDPLAFLRLVSECFTRIETAPKPVIAAVHGHVVAGGLELALVCDSVIARAGTVIGDGHLRNGLLPGAGSSVRLARKVGEPLARHLMLTAELLPAERFMPSGFVHRVCDEQDFEPAVTELARAYTGLPPGHDRMKHLLADPATPEALQRELEVFADHWRERDLATELTEFFAQRATR